MMFIINSNWEQIYRIVWMLKGQFTVLNQTCMLHACPPTCCVFYSSRLFWCKSAGFGDITCPLSNIMELEGTWLVVHKATSLSRNHDPLTQDNFCLVIRSLAVSEHCMLHYWMEPVGHKVQSNWPDTSCDKGMTPSKLFVHWFLRKKQERKDDTVTNIEHLAWICCDRKAVVVPTPYKDMHDEIGFRELLQMTAGRKMRSACSHWL